MLTEGKEKPQCSMMKATNLGLFPIPVKKGGSVTVTVLPDKEIPVPEPALIENSAMALRPKPQGFSEEHELRPYRDGDPINHIHWKLSLKMDDYILSFKPFPNIRLAL